jgi:hypothetical protein
MAACDSIVSLVTFIFSMSQLDGWRLIASTGVPTPRLATQLSSRAGYCQVQPFSSTLHALLSHRLPHLYESPLCLQTDEQVKEAIKEAEQACADGKKGECAAAWDEVEELSAAVSHSKSVRSRSVTGIGN